MTQPPPYYYPYPPRPPDHPQAITVLVLGILSIVVCPLIGPFAWKMGKDARDEIDAAGGQIGGRSQVQAGYVCGIVGTVLLIVYVVLYSAMGLIFLLVAAGGGFAGGAG